MDTLRFILKINFNDYGQQFHEYHQNNQITCQLKSLNIKKKKKKDSGTGINMWKG